MAGSARRITGTPRRRTRGQVLAWLQERVDFERTPPREHPTTAFGLARMRRLLTAVGNPHHRFPVVHVAGTKGKGSTVAMVAEMLVAGGHRVGRYMSPHVRSIEERICVDGRPIRGADLVAAFDVVIPAVESLDRAAAPRGRRGPTWFEAVTAAAMIHFARRQVEIAVLETGLGGRLDATNVSNPLVSVITSVSLDHMELLGRTVGRIAAEKAGIIKRGRPVISGATHPDARRVIAATAARRRAPLLQLGRDFQVAHVPAAAGADPLDGGVVEVTPPPSRSNSGPRRYRVAMAGRHQAENAGIAVATVLHLEAFGFVVPDRAIARALARVRLPARIERVADRPLVVVDAAHNVASMQSLVETLTPTLAARRPGVLVFAASADKQIEEMLACARGRFDRVIVTRYVTNPRAAAIDRLVAACRKAGLPGPTVAESPAEALRLARSHAGPRGVVCVAGSFFLASELRDRV
jgi:dihydrofolate synthase/folylpolyglutamate synthase